MCWDYAYTWSEERAVRGSIAFGASASASEPQADPTHHVVDSVVPVSAPEVQADPSHHMVDSVVHEEHSADDI